MRESLALVRVAPKISVGISEYYCQERTEDEPAQPKME